VVCLVHQEIDVQPICYNIVVPPYGVDRNGLPPGNVNPLNGGSASLAFRCGYEIQLDQVLHQTPILNRLIDARQILHQHAARADIHMPDFGIAHHRPAGRPTCSSGIDRGRSDDVKVMRSDTGVLAAAMALSASGSR